MHEMVHYSFNTFHDEPPRPARSKVPNTNSSFSLDKGSSQTNGFKRTASFVVGQKLRESKWFSHEETKVLCAVLETGFIVEMKNQTGEKLQGIAIWTPGFEKSKDPSKLKIYATLYHKGRYKVQPLNLLEFWPNGTKLRINNHSDKSETPNNEDVIRHQLKCALSSKQKWHNTEHFPHWCRYGQPVNYRAKHTSDNFKFGPLGLSAGFVLFNKVRRASSSK